MIKDKKKIMTITVVFIILLGGSVILYKQIKTKTICRFDENRKCSPDFFCKQVEAGGFENGAFWDGIKCVKK